jgi:hypothetical protein
LVTDEATAPRLGAASTNSLGSVTVLLAVLVVDQAYSSNTPAIALPPREIQSKQ